THTGGDLVGRDAERERLRASLQRALTGARQVVFLTGETGIGKTALVEAFLKGAAEAPGVEIARGQCVAGQVEKEPDYPLLEALGRLGRDIRSDAVVDLLMRHAPTWLTELPSLLTPERRALLQREFFGETHDRMVRELCEALEAFTRRFPLVIVLEDLDLSDPSTLDLISALAHRGDPARLLLLATYDPASAAGHQPHLLSVIRDLQLHGMAGEIALPPLSEGDVARYLAARFRGATVAPDLVAHVYEQTSGNPLLTEAYVEHLTAGDLLENREGAWVLRRSPTLAVVTPRALEELIALQLDRLSPGERQLLDAASVAGQKFAVALIAAALGISAEDAEARCAALAGRGQLLKSTGFDALPDGSFSSTLEF